MKPGKYDLEVYQGDTFRRTLRLRSRVLDVDGVTWIAGDYIDLTGYTGKAQFRETVLAADVAAEVTVTIGDQATLLGSVNLALTPIQTGALAKTGYKWDLQLTDPSGDVNTYLKGDVTVEPEVTHL